MQGQFASRLGLAAVAACAGFGIRLAIVRQTQEQEERPIRYDLDCIVVGTDFSKAAREAVRRSLDLGRRLGASVHVVHVCHKLRPTFPFSKASRAAVERYAREERAEAEQRLQALVPKRSTLDVHTKLLVSQEAHKALLEYTARVGGDLLVVGTHGQSSLEELMVGSTAERCLRSATIPVLMVPAPKSG